MAHERAGVLRALVRPERGKVAGREAEEGMEMKVWVYQGRHGELRVFDVNSRQKARDAQDADNGISVESLRADGTWIDGHPDFGNFSIDEGGSINQVVVE